MQSRHTLAVWTCLVTDSATPSAYIDLVPLSVPPPKGGRGLAERGGGPCELYSIVLQ